MKLSLSREGSGPLYEELGLDYELKRYQRRADNRMAPPEYKALHPMGTSPVLTDGDLVLGESGAICEYLIQAHGNGRLAVKYGEPGFSDYLYWLHFANGTLQPAALRMLNLERVDPSDKNVQLQVARDRFNLILSTLEKRLGHAV